MTDPVIEVAGLIKRYGRTIALDGLDLEVARGEVHGFLGPNGAGKTTTIRILLGLIRADGGTARLFGGDPWSDATELHRRLAYVPGDVTLWPNLTGGEVIDLLGRLRGGLDPAKKEQLLERFDLDPTKKGRTYSKGNRQKVALVAALASDVELLILDEPTAGLDPLMEAEFRRCIEEDRENGPDRPAWRATSWPRWRRLCDRISIVRAGRIVESGTLTELRHLTRTTISAEVEQDPSGLTGLAGVHNLVVRGPQVRSRGRLRPYRRGPLPPGRSGRTELGQPAPDPRRALHAPLPRGHVMKSLVGTGQLVRLVLRRERLRLAVWVAVLTLVPVGTASAFVGLYPSEAERAQLTATVASNPAIVSFLGPVYDSNVGALTAWRVGTIGSLLVGLMAVLTVIRNTREEEETGRRELLGSTVLGRHASSDCCFGGCRRGRRCHRWRWYAAGLVGRRPSGYRGDRVRGGLRRGRRGVCGRRPGVAAQLTQGAGAARGIAVGLVGLAFLLRVAGDGGEASGIGWLSWLSPIGWFTRVRPFASERWSVIAAVPRPGRGSRERRLRAVVPAGRRGRGHRTAARTCQRRLTGSGLRSRWAGGSTGLRWLGWSAGPRRGGSGLRLLRPYSIGDLLDDNPQLAEIFEQLGGAAGITEAFFATAMGILALIATAYAIRSVLRLRVEEEGLRAEPILATATPRLRWVRSHLIFAVSVRC